MVPERKAGSVYLRSRRSKATTPLTYQRAHTPGQPKAQVTEHLAASLPQATKRGRSASSLGLRPRPILAVSQLTEAGSMHVQLTKLQVEAYQPLERLYEVREAQVRGLILLV